MLVFWPVLEEEAERRLMSESEMMRWAMIVMWRWQVLVASHQESRRGGNGNWNLNFFHHFCKEISNLKVEPFTYINITPTIHHDSNSSLITVHWAEWRRECSLTNTTLKLSTKITYLSSARMPRRHQNSFLTSTLVVPHKNVKCDILGLEQITECSLTIIVIEGHGF